MRKHRSPEILKERRREREQQIALLLSFPLLPSLSPSIFPSFRHTPELADWVFGRAHLGPFIQVFFVGGVPVSSQVTGCLSVGSCFYFFFFFLFIFFSPPSLSPFLWKRAKASSPGPSQSGPWTHPPHLSLGPDFGPSQMPPEHV